MCTMLDQRRRRWTDAVQMVYKRFVFTGFPLHEGHARGPELHVEEMQKPAAYINA